ncbi:MAG: MFS transporter [Acidobacteria bacterium]|nr:MFS transporter [Acidobacteriota bacterium]
MLILAAVLAIFVYGMIAAMLGTILPDLSKKFSLTPKQNGSIALAQAIGLMIASLAVGPLIDLQGKKIGLLIGLALIALSLLALPWSKGFGQIAMFMLVLGLGGGIIVTGANALASDISEDKRAATLNMLNLFFGLGGLVTPLVSARLLNNESNKICNFAAILTLATLAVHAVTEMPAPSGQVAFQFSKVTDLLSNGSLMMLAALLFLYVAAEVGVWNWLARHLIAQGVPEKNAMTILSLGFALGLLVGRVAVSPILVSVPATQVLLGASVLMAATTYLMLQSANPKTAWILVFLGGVAMAPVFPTTLAVVGDRFKDMTATAMGVAITCGWLGLVVSSPIIGSVAGDDPKKLKTALLLLPAVSVVMVVVSLAL